MADQMCCVCGKASTKTIGQRAFCDEHFETATHQRKGVWRSVWGQVIALVVFVVLVYAAEAFFKLVLGQTALVLAGVVLAVVPALIWQAFFYKQDRLEPEPKAFIASVFVLAMLVAAAIWLPPRVCRSRPRGPAGWRGGGGGDADRRAGRPGARGERRAEDEQQRR